jgi:hypothetical protein
MEDKHDVQLLLCHPNLDPHHAFCAMGLFLYPDIVLLCWYLSMHLLIGFLSNAMLVHNRCVDAHNPT